jgi:hypothetical protein
MVSISPQACWCSNPVCRADGCQANKRGFTGGQPFVDCDRRARIEKAARAIVASKRGLWRSSPEVDREWQAYVGQAEAAIAAYNEPFYFTVNLHAQADPNPEGGNAVPSRSDEGPVG